MSSGWISLHRQFQDNPLWKEKRVFSKAEAWIDILLMVNHEDKKILIKSKYFLVKRGESLRSLDSWAKRWNWNKSKTRRFLTLLQSENMVCIKNEQKTTRLTVCKYDDYQTNRNDNETIMKRKRHANETQMKPNNNDNNYNNENKIVFDVFWNLYDKKVGDKRKCKKKWDSFKIDLQKEIMLIIPDFVKSIKDKQYQPYPETFLNQERWNDVIELKEIKPMQIDVNGVMKEVAFYKDDGTPVFKGTTKPTLEQIKAMR